MTAPTPTNVLAVNRDLDTLVRRPKIRVGQGGDGLGPVIDSLTTQEAQHAFWLTFLMVIVASALMPGPMRAAEARA